MKIRQIAPSGATRRRLGRLTLASTVVCGFGMAAAPAHAQDIGDAGQAVQNQISPQGQTQDNRGAAQRGIGEAARSLGEGRGVEESLRRGAGEAVRGAGEQISGQQLQQRFGGEVPQQYQDRTMYRDDQGRMFYWNEQGQQVYLQGQAQGQGQFQGQPQFRSQGQPQFQGQGQAQMRGQVRAQQGPTLGVAIDEYDQGVRVLEVMDNTAAAEAGLQQGDVILRVNGEEVQSTDWLGQRINSMQAGEEVTLTVLRDGQEQEISATLQADQRYSARRPAMQGGQQGDLSGLRQQVQQLQREIQTLRQQIDQIKADSDTEIGTRGEAATDRGAAQSDREPQTDRNTRQGAQQSGQTGDAGELDLDADFDAEADAEAGSEAGVGAGAEAGIEAGADQPGQGTSNSDSQQ